MNDPVRNLVEGLVSLSDSIKSTIDRNVVEGAETRDLWSLWVEVAAVRDSLVKVPSSPQWGEFVRTHARSAEYYARKIVRGGDADWGTLTQAKTVLAVMSKITDDVVEEPVKIEVLTEEGPEEVEEVEEVEEPECLCGCEDPEETVDDGEIEEGLRDAREGNTYTYSEAMAHLQDRGGDHTLQGVNAVRRAMERRRLFATGTFPRAGTWQRDLLDRWGREDEVEDGVEGDNPDEEAKSIRDNPTINSGDLDENGHLIIRDARIGAYLGEIDDRQNYVISLPRGTGHLTGPYVMYREGEK